MTEETIELGTEKVRAVDLATEERVRRERLIAFARLAVALVAQVATIFSWTIDVGGWTTVAMTAVDLYILVRHVWWPDNNVTKEAVAISTVKKLVKLSSRNNE